MIVQGQRKPAGQRFGECDDKRDREDARSFVALPPSVDAKMGVEKPAIDKKALEEPSSDKVAAKSRQGTEKDASEKSPEPSTDDVVPTPAVQPKRGPGPLPWCSAASVSLASQATAC